MCGFRYQNQRIKDSAVTQALHVVVAAAFFFLVNGETRHFYYDAFPKLCSTWRKKSAQYISQLTLSLSLFPFDFEWMVFTSWFQKWLKRKKGEEVNILCKGHVGHLIYAKNVHSLHTILTHMFHCYFRMWWWIEWIWLKFKLNFDANV